MVVCASSGAGHSLLCEGINDALVPHWRQLPCWLPVSVGQQGASSTGGVASAPGMLLSWTQTSSLAAVESIEVALIRGWSVCVVSCDFQ